jgi:hypothetical protein
VFFLGWAGGKEQRIQRPVCGGAVTELKRPQALDLDRPSGSGMKQTDSFELTSLSKLVRIESMNTTVAEVADK